MTFAWSSRLLLVLSLLLCSSCVATHSISEEEGPLDKKVIEGESPGLAAEISASQTAKDLESDKEDSESSLSLSPAESSSPEIGAEAYEETVVLPAEQGPEDEYPPEPPPPTNQELLDSALEFCQTSNDFWEQGDLDNAIDALDKAYSLILKMNTDDDPELLQQKEDLRITISKRIVEVYASRFTVANGDHKVIPLVMNRHVERAIAMFKGREKEFFLASYRRSGRYRPAIVRALKDAGIPEELSWLPLIESGFKIRALSRARALGLWQFIASTGYKFGLKRDTWIDERMDPEKSTRAAIAYLKELHKIFGDWITVLAAYNSGERRVLNSIKTQRINYLDNFWDLYERLPRETAFYVPRFLAVLHILNDPEAHGFTLPPVDEEIEVEKVDINKQIHLKHIAKRLDIDYKVLKDLNPELRHHLTPGAHYSLKVPKEKGEILLAKLDDIPVWRPPVPAYRIHKVRYGESLSVIAERYRTSVRAIMAMNGLRRRDYLKVGWNLKIPTKNIYLATGKKSPAYVPKPQGKMIRYKVKTGDSLWKIANRYNTTTKAIRSLNKLPNSRLQIGQILMIATGQTIQKPNNTNNYRVRKGDSPYLIAKRHKMNLADFLKLNHLTPRSTIFPGQMVLIRVE